MDDIPTAAELLATHDDTRPAAHVETYMRYRAPMRHRRAFAALLDYGRTLGLTLDEQQAGGWFTRKGYLRIEGRWDAARHFITRYAKLVGEPPYHHGIQMHRQPREE